MDSLRPPHTRPSSTPTPRESVSPQRSLYLGSDHSFSPTPPESSKPSSRRSSWKKFIWLLGGLLLCLGLGFFFFLFFKTLHVGQSITFENQKSISLFADLKTVASTLFSPRATLKETDGRINLLLLGRAGEHYPGKNLTDTIMLASVDTQARRVALLSFPRDLYVPIGTSEQSTKINSIYQIGLNTQEGVGLLRETIERITGTPIHYSVIVDFDGFEKVVDAIGGITLNVPRDLIDTRYPGKNYSYETFEIHQGWQKLDGTTALKYVRERHADPEGDFGRAKRQQQVMQAVRDKVFSTGTFFNIVTLSHLLDALGESIKTDMTLEDIEAFLFLARTLDTKNITTAVIDAWKPESLLRVSHLSTPSGNAFILVPRTGNWKEVARLTHTIFETDVLKKEREKIETESPTLILEATPSQATLALALKHFFQDELGFASIILKTVPLENPPEHSTIQDMTGGMKSYSYNAILSRFDIQGESAPSSAASQNTDFLLTLGTDLETDAFLGDIGATPEEIETLVLPPQEPKKKSKKH